MGTIIEAPWSLGEGRKGGSSRRHLVEAEPQADQEPSSRGPGAGSGNHVTQAARAAHGPAVADVFRGHQLQLRRVVDDAGARAALGDQPLFFRA